MSGFLDNLPDLGSPDERPSRRQRAPANCVTWRRPRCPRCQSADCPVYDSNHIPYRYHKCRRCGWNFQSFELDYRGPEGDDDGT